LGLEPVFAHDDFDLSDPESNMDGNVIGIDLGLTDFAVTSDGSKYQHPKATKKYERNLKRKPLAAIEWIYVYAMGL
jgi:transposase